MENLKGFITVDDEELILSAVQKGESRTSGEIRIRIERKAGKDPMTVARKVFELLRMRNTELHNGVLFLLALEDPTFVILGDDGINQKVPDDFWDQVREVVLGHFRQRQFAAGLAAGIQ